jgi:hypothetical protein
MRYANLSPSTQLLLIGLIALLSASLFTRAVVFFFRENTGVRPIYPGTWSQAQCRALENIRLLIGLALISFWGLFFFLAPSLPTNWPFGYLHAIFFIILLLISNAWVLLLIPRDWKKFGAISRSFWITIAFLVIWWGAIFTATGWMFSKASAPPVLHALSGVYAMKNYQTTTKSGG